MNQIFLRACVLNMVLCLENYLEILYYIAGIISAILALPSYLIHRHNKKLQKSVNVIKDFQININPEVKANMNINMLKNAHVALVYIDNKKNVIRRYLINIFKNNNASLNLLDSNIEHFVTQDAEARLYSGILNSMETWSINVNRHMTLNKLVKREVSIYYMSIIRKVVKIIGDSNMKVLFPQCWKLFKKWSK